MEASPARLARTLSRLATLGGSDADEGTPATRAEIIHALRASSEPLSAQQLCEQLDLHLNTVRGHLDVLLATGAITKEAGPRSGIGRPPLVYRYTPTADELGARRLRSELLSELADADADTIAQEAALRWLDDGIGIEPHPARSPDDAVDQAVAAAEAAGFTAVRNQLGDRIELTDCPYADLVADRPVICDIHTAMLQATLERAGQGVIVEAMDVWAKPGLCVAHLKRPDLRAARTIRNETEGDES
ncbi:MAG: helix-turn-helix domain-containing protein [Actinobacteria bacterium]|nr:helix-turn-helix domain-containing protein [Actinomycetota bacterium]